MDNNLKILDLPLSERPLEKLLSLGAESLNNSELLAIILRCGVKGENVLSLSQRILCELQGLDGIMNASYDEITSITGIKKVKASQILAVAELFKRFNTLKSNRIEIGISNPKDISRLLMNEMSCLNQEVLKLVVLTAKFPYIIYLIFPIIKLLLGYESIKYHLLFTQKKDSLSLQTKSLVKSHFLNCRALAL